MKDTVERLGRSGYVFKELKPVTPKTLGSRKRIDIYLGIDLQGYYTAVFSLKRKSGIFQKDVEVFDALHSRLEAYADSTIQYKIVLIDAPLCSKAHTRFKKRGWKVLMV
jgi:hypothetical protein